MKIIKLRAENIKKLVAVEITPKGSVVKITGRNASGKSSVLDSIFWALGGTQGIQERPIRQGQKKAEIELDLGEMTVRRTFTENGTALVVENKDGQRFKSPQTLLDSLLGKLGFDPLDFMRQDPRGQVETLKTLTGLDLSSLDEARQKAYDERTAVNREVKRLEIQLEALPVPADAPSKEIDVAELVGKIDEAVAWREKRRRQEELHSRMQAEISELKRTVEELEKRIARATIEIEEKAVALEAIECEIEEAGEVADISALQETLRSAESTNKLAREARRANEERSRLHCELDAAKESAIDLTQQIAGIDEDKSAMIAEACFPLKGLAFGDRVVTYNGLPLAQGSSAEQLRVSMAMAMALNPKLRVIRVTDGSLLDSESLKIIEEMCAESDYQCWLEVVDESGKVGVVISEGQVAAVNE
jgi:DNA repair exonuclease SbcCD ATPase subunit